MLCLTVGSWDGRTPPEPIIGLIIAILKLRISDRACVSESSFGLVIYLFFLPYFARWKKRRKKARR